MYVAVPQAVPRHLRLHLQDKKAKTQAEELAGNKNRSRKQLKRPQGEIKTDLTSVWGGATPVLAAANGEVKQVSSQLGSKARGNCGSCRHNLYIPGSP